MFLMRIQADGREFIMIHDFFMPMIPPTVTAQEKRIGGSGKKRYTYDTPEIKAAKEKIKSVYYVRSKSLEVEECDYCAS